ncbi:MAG: 16S rRNA (cytidine(1402)-2'-O)-methyltransferase [Gammaproteobacteria bacterium]|nr:MAG: 16S rRNA (cytidine(1402)-2'-O)-methyltransferase [Gammaproteobacteria bacterium]
MTKENKADNAPDAAVYVVATPIGNMGDMSRRGVDTLAQVDLIYAEDTRQTNKLLQYFGINNTVYQLHKHNEASQKTDISKQLELGKSVAIVSDAGTPLIADPGYVTLAYLRRQNYPVYVVPGCSAVIAALSISGLPSDHFQFAGFIPAKPGQRQQFLQQYLHSQQTTVFFETPHRIVNCLGDCLTVFGSDRYLFIGRELTKRFEESTLLPLSQAIDWISAHDKRRKGEFVLILAPAGQTVTDSRWQTLAQLMVAERMSTKSIVRIITQYTDVPKKHVYQYVLSLIS